MEVKTTWWIGQGWDSPRSNTVFSSSRVFQLENCQSKTKIADKVSDMNTLVDS